MYYAFMGQCSALAAYLPVGSLNAPAPLGADDPDGQEVVDRIEDPTAPTEADMHRAMMVREVRAFVANLASPLREAAIRHYWCNQSETEIARELGLTQSAIAHRLRKVKRLGRQFFGLASHQLTPARSAPRVGRG